MKTLVILAAGIGSRFGEGIKQLTPIDENGHLIIDYSVYDAVAAGFEKIIFVIRKDIENDFKAAIGDRIRAECGEAGVKVEYAFQEIDDIPVPVPDGRMKPWGTGHAVLCCKDLIDGPFSVINADDYYGKRGFLAASDFLGKGYALVGYRLENTLSDNGGVTRGLCSFSNNELTGIQETSNIRKTSSGIKSGNLIIVKDTLVSMNFWCFPPEFMNILENGFEKFLVSMNNPLKDEYLLPVIADEMIRNGETFSVLPTTDRWVGVTYKEDKPAVIKCFKRLVSSGVYDPELSYAVMSITRCL